MTGPVNIQSGESGVRVEVNPNAYHHADPDVYVARISDANRVPKVGDEVTVIQVDDDPDEPDYISTAEVMEVNSEKGLIVLRVDWKGFHDAPGPPSTVVNYSSARVLSV